jgi:predicted DNA-binding WGR domain protein
MDENIGTPRVGLNEPEAFRRIEPFHCTRRHCDAPLGVDRAKNMARFYVLSIEPTLFDDLALVRRWGRIGSAGRERIDLHPSRPIAQIELKKWLDRKRRRGYTLRA